MELELRAAVTGVAKDLAAAAGALGKAVAAERARFAPDGRARTAKRAGLDAVGRIAGAVQGLSGALKALAEMWLRQG